ncbi:MAG: hypothetical protein AB7P22_17450, partial [Vicinamibacterales bacterium]
GGDFEVTFRLLRDVSPKLKHAGGLALQDMCQGRMALGATRLGFATGTVEWDNVEWLESVPRDDRPPAPKVADRVEVAA